MGNADDNPLICPECDYNLTGLSEDRCPECGTPFDREELQKIASGIVEPVIENWDDGKLMLGYARLWFRTVFTPGEFARRFPARHDEPAALSYSLASYALMGAVLVIGSIVITAAAAIGSGEVIGAGMAVAVGASGSCWVCETVIALLLRGLAKPTRARDRYHFWRGITHHGSGFVLLSALSLITGASAVMVEEVDVGFGGDLWVSFVVAAGASFAWWCTALIVMVVRRSVPGVRRVVGCGLIPLVGVGAVFLGFGFSFLLLSACTFGAF